MTIREQFPILEHTTYLNSCSQGALSVVVADSYQRYLRDWDEKGSPWELWVELSEQARAEFARLIEVDPDEVAVTTSASAGVSALASCFDFASDDRNEIVISDLEFPTVAQIWHAQERRGAKVTQVPASESGNPIELFEHAITEQTKLVSITHVSFRNGARLDVPAIAEIAHRNGALVLLDSYQTLGSMPVHPRDLGVDFLVGGVLKYLLASAGLAFLYARQDLVESLVPTAMGWFSQADIFAMDINANTPSPTARRFESGTPPVPSIYAGLAGMGLIRSIGLEVVEKHISELTTAIKEMAQERGLHVVSPTDPRRHGALITLKSNDVTTLVQRLAGERVITSSRDDNLRISPHIYNQHADIERLFEVLDANRDLLVPQPQKELAKP
ncbi:MAG TPA: aminotransferase class V-fold PLP-dependent enzyme [Acidimicrobiia bacterium]|nr:aminotransferase class V-fold PLP-dependent enzyme [Acidimicrobiia bacterium]